MAIWIKELILSSGAVCRRRRPDANDVCVGSDPLKKDEVKSSEGMFEAERTSDSNPGAARAESAVLTEPQRLKAAGNRSFAQGHLAAAVENWSQARKLAEDAPDLLRSIDANLALAHLRLEEWDEALSSSDAALAGSEVRDVKVLHRRALALAGLKHWNLADTALTEFEACGGGAALAEQTRRDWARARGFTRAGASSSKPKDVAVAQPQKTAVDLDGALVAGWPQDVRWAHPRFESTKAFDLRQDGFAWKDEDDKGDDFKDSVWNSDGITGRLPENYMSAFPLSVLAGAALSQLAPLSEGSDAVIHVFRDSSSGHDWVAFLSRYPAIKTLRIVYVGLFGNDGGNDPFAPNLGELTVASEEGQTNDGRSVYVSRFTGGYAAFLLLASRLVPEIAHPWLAVFNDVPFGIATSKLGVSLEAFSALGSRRIPVAFTLSGNAKDRELDAVSQRSVAALRWLQAKPISELSAWQWNRFSVPGQTDVLPGGQGKYVMAHAVIGVFQLKMGGTGGSDLPSASSVFDALRERHVPDAPQAPAEKENKDANAEKAEKMKEMLASDDFQKKMKAFQKKMEAEGRPTGENLTSSERHKQGLEFAMWSATCARNEWDEDYDKSLEGPQVEEIEEQDYKPAQDSRGEEFPVFPDGRPPQRPANYESSDSDDSD